MFVRPELRKGDVDVRLKAPKTMIEKLDLLSIAFGLTRQDVIPIALDAYVQELSHVSKVLAPAVAKQRNRDGNGTDEER